MCRAKAGRRRQSGNNSRRESVSQRREQELVQDNDHFFPNPLPFLKVTMGRNIMKCQRLVSAFLRESAGTRNNPPYYLNLGFQIKSWVLLNELNSAGKNEFSSNPNSPLNWSWIFRPQPACADLSLPGWSEMLKSRHVWLGIKIHFNTTLAFAHKPGSARPQIQMFKWPLDWGSVKVHILAKLC